jgi:hypothetical protein
MPGGMCALCLETRDLRDSHFQPVLAGAISISGQGGDGAATPKHWVALPPLTAGRACGREQ